MDPVGDDEDSNNRYSSLFPGVLCNNRARATAVSAVSKSLDRESRLASLGHRRRLPAPFSLTTPDTNTFLSIPPSTLATSSGSATFQRVTASSCIILCRHTVPSSVPTTSLTIFATQINCTGSIISGIATGIAIRIVLVLCQRRHRTSKSNLGVVRNQTSQHMLPHRSLCCPPIGPRA